MSPFSAQSCGNPNTILDARDQCLSREIRISSVRLCNILGDTIHLKFISDTHSITWKCNSEETSPAFPCFS
ncbi:hypothetical protein HALA3H3_570006 [Halomonas sp. A3H3]|nr:conserved hypothetical protein [Halomonas sp. 59]CAD5256783.1 conserved hypothetical protein [Halomonas sp. 113]CAD5270565.1 conserved hypothetical protein [Halomonas sp. I3]CAD5292136.1 conserved hypothetical protein [Halomonas sp. 156]CDG53625.1 hypothetical protein HALA3H3_570006 [Halomonas sp. A3H3]VXB21075.1 conserved hypothetical protein [Halomonas titanicae]